ncbi:MAG: undecaprenyldiphospho-muramoylpentapeptide beta-N-acetylglucosaminyltransferase [Clostridiales bacterium]|nr:undecaprenyldiphospho-muramoylpentapeptide beta-N-acetylglucosaminyltransferase [Clostridiales bacterium]
MKKKIVFTGGGTAGHIYPALAVAEKLKDFELHYIGGNGLEKEILDQHPNIKFHEISTVKLERKLTLKNLLIPFKLLKSIKESKKILKEVSPSLIFSKGGFVSVPVVIAGKKTKVPTISHESDLSMGLANKIILKYCDTMCTSFKQTASTNSKCVYTGQPIRQKIFMGKKLDLDFDKSKPTILILGGSLGAKFLNDIIFDNLDSLTKNYNLLHITGKKNFKDVKHKNYKCVAYAENIEDFYASADLVVARAGSGVINELLSLQKPMLLIPLSKKCSRGDQIENAKLFEKLGYAEMIEEEEFGFEFFFNKIEKISKNKQNIIQNMKKTAKNNAVDNILEILYKYIKN